MQKGLYDSSCLTWNPQGRLYQVEYAMEAVNQGTCLIGLKSKNHVVLCGLKSTVNDTLGYFQDKLYSISPNVGMGISGLTPDGRLVHKYLKSECLNYSYVYDSVHPVERLITKFSQKSQKKTQGGNSKRPYGVGTLIAGYDVIYYKLYFSQQVQNCSELVLQECIMNIMHTLLVLDVRQRILTWKIILMNFKIIL